MSKLWVVYKNNDIDTPIAFYQSETLARTTVKNLGSDYWYSEETFSVKPLAAQPLFVVNMPYVHRSIPPHTLHTFIEETTIERKDIVNADAIIADIEFQLTRIKYEFIICANSVDLLHRAIREERQKLTEYLNAHSLVCIYKETECHATYRPRRPGEGPYIYEPYIHNNNG